MSLNGISPNFASKFEKASQDGMITNRELKDLSSKIQGSDLPQEEKDNLISNIKKQTNVDIDINSITINGICEKCKSKMK